MVIVVNMEMVLKMEMVMKMVMVMRTDDENDTNGDWGWTPIKVGCGERLGGHGDGLTSNTRY